MTTIVDGTIEQTFTRAMDHAFVYGHRLIAKDNPFTWRTGFRCNLCDTEWYIEVSKITKEALSVLSDEDIELLKTEKGMQALADKVNAGKLSLVHRTGSTSPGNVAPIRKPVDLSDWRTWARTEPGHCACGIPRNQCDYHKG